MKMLIENITRLVDFACRILIKPIVYQNHDAKSKAKAGNFSNKRKIQKMSIENKTKRKKASNFYYLPSLPTLYSESPCWKWFRVIRSIRPTKSVVDTPWVRWISLKKYVNRVISCCKLFIKTCLSSLTYISLLSLPNDTCHIRQLL